MFKRTIWLKGLTTETKLRVFTILALGLILCSCLFLLSVSILHSACFIMPVTVCGSVILHESVCAYTGESVCLYKCVGGCMCMFLCMRV